MLKSNLVGFSSCARNWALVSIILSSPRMHSFGVAVETQNMQRTVSMQMSCSSLMFILVPPFLVHSWVHRLIIVLGSTEDETIMEKYTVGWRTSSFFFTDFFPWLSLSQTFYLRNVYPLPEIWMWIPSLVIFVEILPFTAMSLSLLNWLIGLIPNLGSTIWVLLSRDASAFANSTKVSSFVRPMAYSSTILLWGWV